MISGIDGASRTSSVLGLKVSSLDQRADVLRQARAAEAGAGVQEFRPNSIVEPDPARNFLHIRADALAEIGYFVDEGDLGGQECVRCVLNEFRCPAGANRPCSRFERTISPSPGSNIGISPAFRVEIFVLSLSTHMT